MTLHFLGTGTSTGVPQLGCNCPTCTSADPRDKRLRCSALLEINDPKAKDGTTRILFDCGPDFRQQMLAIGFRHIDAVLITHEHYDHVGGLDDLRPFKVFGDLAVYAEPMCASHLRERLPYCFTPKEQRYPGAPAIDLEDLTFNQPFMVNGVEVTPIRVWHGKLPIAAYRIGNFAYITDMKSIETEQFQLLKGVEFLVVNGLQHEEHPTHQTIPEAIEFADKLNAKEAYMIHMSHRVRPHAMEASLLPPHRHLTYDGLTINF